MHVTSITYPNATGAGPSTQTQFLYDGAGRRLFRRDDLGSAVYSYDTLGRLSTVLSAEENVSFGYDAVGNRTSVSYSLGTVQYAYDGGNRMTTVTDPLNNVTTYSYDKYGHVKQVALPNNITRNYTYWALPGGQLTNRLQSLSTTSSTNTNFWTGNNYQYDYVGNVRNVNASWNQTPSTYTLTATYDNLYRLTQWKDTSASDSSTSTNYFSYDAAGNRLTWGNQNPTGTSNFKTPPTWANTYPSQPNPTPWIENQNASYNAANRATTQNTSWSDSWRQLSPSSPGSPNLTQEPNGNESLDQYSLAKQQYTFDDANRLTHYHGELNDPGVSWVNMALGWSEDDSYHYDGDGRRFDWNSTYIHGYYYNGPVYGQKTTTTSYKQYEYVGSDVVAERSQGGAVAVWYVYGAGGDKLYTVHWSTSSSSLTADVYAKDHLGSIREVVNSSGQTANSYNYDAFGQPTGQSVQLANSYQFASASLDGVNYYDAGSGTYKWATSFYNLNARLYNPQAGRFLSQDTYRGNPWQPWTQNLYSYVGNNPINMTDPTGHRPCYDPDAADGCGSGPTSGGYTPAPVSPAVAATSQIDPSATVTPPVGQVTYVLGGIGNEGGSHPDDPDHPERPSIGNYDGYTALIVKGLINRGIGNVFGLNAFPADMLKGIDLSALAIAGLDNLSRYVAGFIIQDLKAKGLFGKAINLVGYSGGGLLAMNVARILLGKVAVDAVVTMATPIYVTSYVPARSVHMAWSESDVVQGFLPGQPMLPAQSNVSLTHFWGIGHEGWPNNQGALDWVASFLSATRH